MYWLRDSPLWYLFYTLYWKKKLVSLLAAGTICYANLRDEEFTTHILNYGALLRPFNPHHLLTGIENCFIDSVFERRLQVESTDSLLVSWHWLYFLVTPPDRHRELIVKFPEWWECYERSRLLYATLPVVFAFFLNLVLFDDYNNLLFRVAVAQGWVFCLMSLLAFAVFCGSCPASRNLPGSGILCQGGILLPLSKGVLQFVKDVGFFETVRGCTSDIPQT